MAQEISRPLDTSSLQHAYPHEASPAHERFGEGERYTFGSTLADVYSNPPELTPVVYVRMVKGYLAVGDVLHVLPTEAGGYMSIMPMVRVRLAKQGTWPLCIRRLLHFVCLRREERKQMFMGEVTPKRV
jgi:hypothetical protein